MALVIHPDITISKKPAGTFRSSVVTANAPNHVWLEGSINAAENHSGVSWKVVRFSTMRNLTVAQAKSIGIDLERAKNNVLHGLTTANNLVGVRLHASNNNKLSDVTTVSIRTVDVDVGPGIQIDSHSNNNTLTGITAVNSFHGIAIHDSNNNTLSQTTVANNISNGIALDAVHNTILLGVTAVNNGARGASFYRSVITDSNNLFSRFTAANNHYQGIFFGDKNENTLSAAAIANNKDSGIYVEISDNDRFQVGNHVAIDRLGCMAKSNKTDCDALHASLTKDITLVQAFVGKVTGDQQNSSDRNGTLASFPRSLDQFDLVSFENPFRGWGKDGADFPSDDNRGRWDQGPGRIWDWSLAAEKIAGDNPILGVLQPPTGDDVSTHTWLIPKDHTGDCEALILGSVSATIDGTEVCQTTFLRNATEIQNDGLGNDNALCESGETCLYTPNIASYQGHGNLISAGAFRDGELTNITLMQYEHNGR